MVFEPAAYAARLDKYMANIKPGHACVSPQVHHYGNSEINLHRSLNFLAGTVQIYRSVGRSIHRSHPAARLTASPFFNL
jgi:hypothetical protein